MSFQDIQYPAIDPVTGVPEIDPETRRPAAEATTVFSEDVGQIFLVATLESLPPGSEIEVRWLSSRLSEPLYVSTFTGSGVHALVAKLLPGAQPIHKATIIPRGQSLGMVSFLTDERRSVPESRLRAHLATALGGCCAETLIFEERTTGAQADYKQVTVLARSMVCDWGMSEVLGPVSLGGENDEVFLGREFTRARRFSERTAETIDQEIHKLVTEAENTASGLLADHVEQLHALAAALLACVSRPAM
jgi:cell division protease FtsH